MSSRVSESSVDSCSGRTLRRVHSYRSRPSLISHRRSRVLSSSSSPLRTCMSWRTPVSRSSRSYHSRSGLVWLARCRSRRRHHRSFRRPLHRQARPLPPMRSTFASSASGHTSQVQSTVRKLNVLLFVRARCPCGIRTLFGVAKCQNVRILRQSSSTMPCALSCHGVVAPVAQSMMVLPCFVSNGAATAHRWRAPKLRPCWRSEDRACRYVTLILCLISLPITLYV